MISDLLEKADELINNILKKYAKKEHYPIYLMCYGIFLLCIIFVFLFL